MPHFKPYRHIPHRTQTYDMNMSPIESYKFGIFHLMQNEHILIHSVVVHKYVCKYIGKIEKISLLFFLGIQAWIFDCQGNVLVQHQNILIKYQQGKKMVSDKKQKICSKQRNQSNRYASFHVEVYRGSDRTCFVTIPIMSPYLFYGNIDTNRFSGDNETKYGVCFGMLSDDIQRHLYIF